VRVVLVAFRFPTPSETFVVSLFRRLLDHGVDVHVVCATSTRAEIGMFPELVGAERRIHRTWPVEPRLLAAGLLPVAILRCLFTAPGRTVRYLARGWRIFGLRVLRRLYHDAELIVLGPHVAHMQFGANAIGREAIGRLLGCAAVVSFQGADLNFVGLDAEPGYWRGVWTYADGIHFSSDDLERRARRRGWTPDERGAVITPTIDLARFAPQPRDHSDGPLRIIAVGRLHWKKGYEFALQAVRRLVDDGIACEFTVIGEGEHRPAVEQAIRDLRLESIVNLLGAQASDRVRAEMQASDVLLHAAVSEGFCIVALEAQAMQLPVVTSDADGLRQNVIDGVTAFVVPRRDPAALAAKLALLAREPSLRARMGEAGRRRACDAPDQWQQLAAYEALYGASLARVGVRSPGRDD
jgi:colanic acid/amylovoran biosynthesis glycosyltransferase